MNGWNADQNTREWKPRQNRTLGCGNGEERESGQETNVPKDEEWNRHHVGLAVSEEGRSDRCQGFPIWRFWLGLSAIGGERRLHRFPSIHVEGQDPAMRKEPGSALRERQDRGNNPRCAYRMETRWLRLQPRCKFFRHHRDTAPKFNLTLEFISLGVWLEMISQVPGRYGS
jgi:hypothetical protein